MRTILILLSILIGFFLWKNLTIPQSTGLIDGKLQPCPSSPNCVNCDAKDPTHAIAPLPLIQGKSLDDIEKFLKEHYDSQVITKTPTYMHVVVTTKVCRFKDDLEFLVVESDQLICVRSASRVGYGDGGVNRDRIEHLRQALFQ